MILLVIEEKIGGGVSCDDNNVYRVDGGRCSDGGEYGDDDSGVGVGDDGDGRGVGGGGYLTVCNGSQFACVVMSDDLW